MSGMAGYFGFKETCEVREVPICGMLESICHRGEKKKAVALGSIGRLGVRYNFEEKISCDNKKGLWCAMDGEIFWTEDLRPIGTSIGDAQLLLDLYQRHGLDFPRKIDGSYAAAIWDECCNRLTLVRDRLGTKPLFFIKKDGYVIFASEVKAIVGSGLYEKDVDLEALNYFLTFGYIPTPYTMFKNIMQVKPGGLCVFEAGDQKEIQYWKFEYKPVRNELSESDYADEFFHKLKEAISRRFHRHPEAGAFLSGGLDSSAVSAVLHELKGTPHKVFTAGFHEKAYNEIEDAKIVANAFHLEQFITLIDFNHHFPKLLEKLVWHHDGPFSDTSAIPSYYAAELARAHVDTVFTGDFPDQLIGGSGHQVFALGRQLGDPVWKKMLRSGPFKRWAQMIPFSANGTGMLDKVKRALYRETFPLEEQRILMSMPVPVHLKRKLYGEKLLSVDAIYDPMRVARQLYKEVANEELLNKILYFDIQSYALDNLMVKVDRMCSAHGLNAISPFHDVQLVEFVAALPSHMKIRGQNRKYVMREALRSRLPDPTLNKKKQGFAMPIGDWLIQKLSAYVQEILLDSRTLNRGYFNRRFLENKINEFLVGRTDYASGSETMMIALITLELWHRQFIDN